MGVRDQKRMSRRIAPGALNSERVAYHSPGSRGAPRGSVAPIITNSNGDACRIAGLHSRLHPRPCRIAGHDSPLIPPAVVRTGRATSRELNGERFRRARTSKRLLATQIGSRVPSFRRGMVRQCTPQFDMPPRWDWVGCVRTCPGVPCAPPGI